MILDARIPASSTHSFVPGNVLGFKIRLRATEVKMSRSARFVDSSWIVVDQSSRILSRATSVLPKNFSNARVEPYEYTAPMRMSLKS
jgi:hypothetical protein